jgi:shikimate kinase
MIIQRLFSKVWMKDGKKEISELSDKQLENLSRYNDTRAKKRNVIKNGQKLVTSSGVVGGAIGGVSSGYKFSAIKNGALIGAGVGTGLSLYGHHRNKKLAKEAKEELEKRRQKK